MKPQDLANPKAKQFTEELNELLAKYQYQLDPQITVTTKGVVPIVVLKEVVPPKGKIAVEVPVVKKHSGTSGSIVVKKAKGK